VGADQQKEEAARKKPYVRKGRKADQDRGRRERAREERRGGRVESKEGGEGEWIGVEGCRRVGGRSGKGGWRGGG